MFDQANKCSSVLYEPAAVTTPLTASWLLLRLCASDRAEQRDTAAVVMGDTDGSATEPLFAPGAREAEQGGQHGVIADGEFVSEEHYSQRANWLRAGA